MSTKEEREARFVLTVMGEQRKFPWSWSKTAEYVLGLRKGAQLEGALAGQGIAEPQGAPEAENEDIVRGLLQVHQQQQQTVAAAEAEGRTLRMELDKSKQQLQNLFMQSQQQQSQMQQMQAQAQQAVQQAKMQTEQVQQMAGPEIQKAQQAAAMAQQQATQTRIDQAKMQQLYEQTRRAVLDYKGSIMQAVAQDPITMAEAQKMQQDQAMAAQAQQAQAQQQAIAAQQGPQQGAPPQGAPQGGPPQGEPKTASAHSPVEQIARSVAGQGERAGYRRALAEQYLNQAAQQGAKAGQGGTKIPFDSLAAEVLKQGSVGEAAVKVALDLNSVANDLRRLQGGRTRLPDSSVLLKISQVSLGLNRGLDNPVEGFVAPVDTSLQAPGQLHVPQPAAGFGGQLQGPSISRMPNDVIDASAVLGGTVADRAGQVGQQAGQAAGWGGWGNIGSSIQRGVGGVVEQLRAAGAQARAPSANPQGPSNDYTHNARPDDAAEGTDGLMSESPPDDRAPDSAYYSGASAPDGGTYAAPPPPPPPPGSQSSAPPAAPTPPPGIDLASAPPAPAAAPAASAAPSAEGDRGGWGAWGGIGRAIQQSVGGVAGQMQAAARSAADPASADYVSPNAPAEIARMDAESRAGTLGQPRRTGHGAPDSRSPAPEPLTAKSPGTPGADAARAAVQRGIRNVRVGSGVRDVTPAQRGGPQLAGGAERHVPKFSPGSPSARVPGFESQTRAEAVAKGAPEQPAASPAPAAQGTAPDWAVNRARTWIQQHPGRAPTQQELASTEGPVFPEQG